VLLRNDTAPAAGTIVPRREEMKLTTGAMFDFVILSAALPQMRYNMSSALKNMNMTILGLAESRLPIT